MSIKHIAFIMDGNGRWAKLRGLARKLGHRQGLKKAEEVIEWCIESKIEIVSLYVFSTENWSRPQEEIDSLFKLADQYISNFNKFCKDRIRVIVSGQKDRLPKSMVEKIAMVEKSTKQNNNITVNLCLSYGGRQDIVDTVNVMIARGECINEQSLLHAMTTVVPQPDMIVRTGGQRRLSNFFLYQAAYTELYFSDVLWPDFSRQEFDAIVERFCNTQRNFGGVVSE